MLSFLERISLSRKLIVMLLAPCLGLLWFAASEVVRTLALKTQGDALTQLIELSVKTGDMVHTLQKERGFSAGYLGSKGKKFVQELPAQHTETNPNVANLRTFLENFDAQSFGSEFTSKLGVGLTELDKLESVRTRIKAQNIAAKEAIGYYTGMNAAFLDLIGFMPKLSSVGALNNNATAYFNYLQSKERAGIERAVMTNTFAVGEFAGGFEKKFTLLVSQQATYADNFIALAAPELVTAYEQAMSAPQVTEVERMRQVAFAAGSRIKLVGKLNRLLGYGGLIHQFKNYVLRGRDANFEAFNSQYQEVSVLLGQLAALPNLDETAKHSIDTIKTTVDKYKAAIATTATLIQDSHSVTDIDAQIKISDGPALKALESLGKGSFGIDPAHWFKTITGKINLLKDVENKVSADLAKQANTLRDNAVSMATLAGVLMVVALGLSMVLAWLCSKAITGPIRTAMTVANGIAAGDLSADIEIKSHDETGQLLQSMKTMQAKLTDVIESDVQSLVDAARSGDLSQRITLDGKEGFYEKLSTGVNDLVDVSDRVVNDTVQVFGAMAKGDLRTTIETEYQGAFDQLKRDANATVNTLSAVIEQDIQVIVDSARNGDLSQRIDLEGKTGFYEHLSAGVNELVSISEQVINDTIQMFSAMAIGNLTKTIDAQYEGSFGQLKHDANSTVAKLIKVVGEIQIATNSVSVSADEISKGNTDLSQRTEEQASSLEETASSMEEMTSAVRQNADNAEQASQLASAAQEQAEKGGSVVNQAVVAMGEINTSSRKISDIISVIDEIAFQTNLLALNASVEAARAGDQGRGFAVVASEVRNLAGRSATAAKEIKDLIEDSVSKVQDGSRLVNESGEMLGGIVDGVKKVSSVVSEIAGASKEQSTGIEEVNKAVMQMDELTQQNAALVEQAAAASESLGEQTQSLHQMMDFFKVADSDRVDDDMLAQRPVNDVAVSAPSAGERRSQARPWAAPKQSQAASPAMPEPQPKLAAAAAGGGTADDDEWQEF